jgi:hypothetical protein
VSLSAVELFVQRPGHPLRPATWRWAAANYVRNRPPADPVTYQDEYCRAAGDLQEGLAGASSDELRAALLFKAGAAADAYVFWISASTAEGNPHPDDCRDYPMAGAITAPALAKAELEALILAGKPVEKIARHVGLDPETVRWYERLWFDVRDRLRRPGWVAQAVIGSLHQGSPAALLPALVRAYGYYTKSARLVKAVVAAFDAPAARKAARDPARFFMADAAHASGLKAALAARLLPLDRRTYARVVELHHEALDLEAKAQLTGSSAAESTYLDAVNRLSGALAHGYGEPVDLPPEPPLCS